MGAFKTSVKEKNSLPRISPPSGSFRVSSIDEGRCGFVQYNRRDFYKITLVLRGCSQLLYASRGINITAPALVFTNPMVPYSWESNQKDSSGYFCIFNDEFLHGGNKMESLQHSALFKPHGEPVYFLNDSQADYITHIFERMHHEADLDYAYKFELIRNQVNLLLHEAIKMQPVAEYFTPSNAATRITQLFLELLERQFPVDSPRFILSLKKAGDYAEKLSVHVNHLNAVVQEVTGKSTTTHINGRIIAEAKSLLTHTDWDVSEIAYSLGFEYVSYFNNFFKKHTGVTPTTLRK
ncbi:MAG: AraC family transcriptional regulator [Chitinophagaceae bacterium]|nr:AraC family transcriptional regulator [Chitinophagaceae bacterium]